MRLLILSDGHVWKSKDLCWSRDPWLKSAGYLEPFFSSILICVPLRPGSDDDYAISLNKGWEGKNIQWIHTFPHETVINYYKMMPFLIMKNMPIIMKAVQNSDAVFLRLPSMNGFLAAPVARLLGKSLFCYFSGDQKVQIIQGKKYRGIWTLPAKVIASFHDFLNRRIVGISRAAIFEALASLDRFGPVNEQSVFMFPSTIESAQIRERNGNGADRRLNLFYAGRLAAEKGLEYLIQAMSLLNREKMDCNLNICGDGPDRGSLELLVKKLCLESTVNFLGHVRWGPKLDRIYQENDVLVLPSLSEGVPKVALEAMANGLAVIATSVGGLPRIINNGKNGILVPPASSQALCEAVKSLLNDQDLRHRLVRNGYDFIREHTAEKQAEKIAKIIINGAGSGEFEKLHDVKNKFKHTSSPPR